MAFDTVHDLTRSVEAAIVAAGYLIFGKVTYALFLNVCNSIDRAVSAKQFKFFFQIKLKKFIFYSLNSTASIGIEYCRFQLVPKILHFQYINVYIFYGVMINFTNFLSNWFLLLFMLDRKYFDSE